MNNIFVSAWQQSDWAGKIDLLVLFFLSIYSWYIIFYKFFHLKSVGKKNKMIGNIVTSGERIIPLDCPLYNVIKESKKIFSQKGNITQEEIEKVIFKHANMLKENLSVLATISSVSPFLGLLGTVWGLLRSFQSISVTGSASVKVVSAGVAEALITTVVGLIVAIPAAVGYNYFQEKTEKIKENMLFLSIYILNSLSKDE